MSASTSSSSSPGARRSAAPAHAKATTGPSRTLLKWLILSPVLYMRLVLSYIVTGRWSGCQVLSLYLVCCEAQKVV